MARWLLGALTTWLACTASPPPPPDIVVVLLEDLRADVLPPAAARALLEEAGIEGTSLPSAYAQSVHEFLSLGSLLTGRYVSAIPLCSRPGSSERGRPVRSLPWCVRPPPSSPTLGEVPQLYGYRAALFTADLPDAALLVHGWRHEDLPADGRDEPPEEAVDRTWEGLATRAAAWWNEDPGRPRLLVLEAPLMVPALEERWVQVYFDRDLPAEEKARRIAADPDRYGRLAPDMPWPFRDAAFLEARRREYLAAARHAGRGIRSALESLPTDRPRGLVLTSLHGMSLGETTGSGTPEQTIAGRWRVLLDRTLHVPLVVDPPAGHEVRVTDEPVELVDLFPTIAAWAGARPPADLPGRDLATAEPDPEPTAYAEFADMLALRKGRWFLVFRHQDHTATSLDPKLTWHLRNSLAGEYRDSFHLHDLVADPAQAHDLFRPEDPVFLELRQDLLALRTGPAAPPSGALDPERVQALRDAGALEYW